MFGPEGILTATQPIKGPSPRKFSFTTPSSSSETPFSRDRTEAGGRLRGLCFPPFYSVFLKKELITVYNHEII